MLATNRTISRGSERVVFGCDCCIVYTKRVVVRKSVFVQKGGRFASIFFMYGVIGRKKNGTLFEQMNDSGPFFAYRDSICEYVVFLPLFHALCPFESYTTSLQKRRNSQVTQRYWVEGAAGISSLSTIRWMCWTVCTTFFRRCGVIGMSSARLSGME